MANQISLKAKARSSHGRNAVNQLRKTGAIPGIIYGRKTTPQNVEICLRELQTALRKTTSENILVDLQLDIDGKIENRFALLQEIQRDYLRDLYLHVDFQEVAQDETIHLEVAVESEGEPTGVKTGGGLLEHTLRILHIECLPKDIPDAIWIDVSSLNIGESIHVKDIIAPAGVKITSQPELTVFACVAPKSEEAAAAVIADATKEVEVIKERNLLKVTQKPRQPRKPRNNFFYPDGAPSSGQLRLCFLKHVRTTLQSLEAVGTGQRFG